MEVPIESRADYELYVRKQVKALRLPTRVAQLVGQFIMAGFDDGMTFQANAECVVEVKDD